jgi:hypothetical protein
MSVAYPKCEVTEKSLADLIISGNPKVVVGKVKQI